METHDSPYRRLDIVFWEKPEKKFVVPFCLCILLCARRAPCVSVCVYMTCPQTQSALVHTRTKNSTSRVISKQKVNKEKQENHKSFLIFPLVLRAVDRVVVVATDQ